MATLPQPHTQRVLDSLEGVKPTTNGWKARCRAHDDRDPSLSIKEADDGTVLLYCHAGCEREDIVRSMGLEMTDLFPPKNEAVRSNGRREEGPLGPIVAEYLYPGPDGVDRHRVTRHHPKAFRPWHRDEGGKWVLGEGKVKMPLYRQPDLSNGDTNAWVLVPEGEKDCDGLAAQGFVAITNPFGAGKWRSEFSDCLRGRRACILPDNDDTGRKGADQVAGSLFGIAAEVKVLQLPGLPENGDISDWLGAGGKPEELARLIEEAPPWAPSTADPARHDGKRGSSATVGREAVGVLASEVRPERILWLSRGRLAAGKATIVDGDPELGKTTLAFEWAARMTRGEALPGGQSGKPRGVVILSAEDGLADTIVPRLTVAEADLAKVYIMTGIRALDGVEVVEDAVTLPTDLRVVEQAIRDYDAALLIVDPLMAYLGADVNSNRDQDVRRAMAPLATMLEKTGCAALLLRHLNKGSGGQAIYRGGGSIGIIGAARIGLLVAKDPDDEEARILAPVKVNIGPHPPSLRFRLRAVEGTDVARIEWDSEPANGVDAKTLLAAAMALDPEEEPTSARAEAGAWLRTFLKDGPQEARRVQAEARKDCLAPRTLARAKAELRVESRREDNRWVWLLPLENSANDAQDPDVGNLGILGTLGENARTDAESETDQGCQDSQGCQGCQSSEVGTLGISDGEVGEPAPEPEGEASCRQDEPAGWWDSAAPNEHTPEGEPALIPLPGENKALSDTLMAAEIFNPEDQAPWDCQRPWECGLHGPCPGYAVRGRCALADLAAAPESWDQAKMEVTA